MVATIEHSPDLTEAESVLAQMQELKVGECIHFNPPVSKPATDVLFVLLRSVDKGWRIEPGPLPKVGFWKGLFANYPVDFGGRPIPQTIARIERRR